MSKPSGVSIRIDEGKPKPSRLIVDPFFDLTAIKYLKRETSWGAQQLTNFRRAQPNAPLLEPSNPNLPAGLGINQLFFQNLGQLRDLPEPERRQDFLLLLRC